MDIRTLVEPLDSIDEAMFLVADENDIDVEKYWAKHAYSLPSGRKLDIYELEDAVRDIATSVSFKESVKQKYMTLLAVRLRKTGAATADMLAKYDTNMMVL